MEKAISAVTKEGLSIRRAVLQFNVPKSSLGDRVSGRVAHGTMSGPPKYLTDAQEIKIVHFLTRTAAIGYPKSHKDVMALVQRVLDSKGLGKSLTSGWWESFIHRHPNPPCVQLHPCP